MFDHIYSQVLVTGEKLKGWIQWVIPIGISIIALLISARRNKKKEHDHEHEEIISQCTEFKKELNDKLKDMETRVLDIVKKNEESNTASHGRLSRETERYYSLLEKQFASIEKSVSDKIEILIELIKAKHEN